MARPAPCADPQGRCTHRFAYDWDEVGKLIRVRRWDYAAIPADEPIYPNLPGSAAGRDTRYAYAASGERVIRSTVGEGGVASYTLDVFSTLRLVGTSFDSANGDYLRNAASEMAQVPSLARILVRPGLPRVGSSDRHVLLEMHYHLGSVTTVIDQSTSELVESIAYQAYGSEDSAYRSQRWAGLFSDRRFDGKEAESDLGLVYFGARYYQPALGRWISPDPLTIHGLASDQNPYAFVAGSPVAAADPLGLQPCIGAEQCGDPEDSQGSGSDDGDDYGYGGGGRGGGGGGAPFRGPPGQGPVAAAPAGPPPYSVKESLNNFVIEMVESQQPITPSLAPATWKIVRQMEFLDHVL